MPFHLRDPPSDPESELALADIFLRLAADICVGFFKAQNGVLLRVPFEFTPDSTHLPGLPQADAKKTIVKLMLVKSREGCVP